MKQTVQLFDRIPSLFPSMLESNLVSSFVFDEFEKFFANPKLKQGFAFPVDIYNVTVDEKIVKTVVEIAMAGVPKDWCNVRIDNNKLIVDIKKPEENKEETKEERVYVQRQISQRSTYISWILNDKINKKKVTVDYKDGILKISLPFVESELVEPINLKIN